MMKVLSMAVATVMLTGCGNQSTEDISSIINDGVQVAKAVEAEPEAISVSAEAGLAENAAPAETKPAATVVPATAEPESTAAPTEAEPESTATPITAEPESTAAPAETKPAATAPPAEQKSAPAFQCLCGFTAATEEELYNHILSEAFGSGTEIQFSGTQSPETQPSGTQPPGTQPVETAHEHVWKEHSSQRWVPKIVTVVDEPAQYEKYDLYRIYWYDTNTWEETRDPARYEAWWNDANGGSWLLYNNYEDSPLFLGYNDQGGYSLTSDHAVISGNYECISPEITHEEDQGYYETYVDYYYCDCGATK